MTQQPLLSAAPDPWPEAAVESIRKIYPTRKSRAAEQERIRQALDRIVGGEIDGKPRTPEQAIAFLREKVTEARATLSLRERKYIPHLTTWLHQSRYLRTLPEAVPANLEEAITILQCYPGIASTDWDAKKVEAHMAALRLIDEHIRYLTPTHGQAAASYLRTRVIRYAECVARWPSQDLQYVPGVMKWFGEQRYGQHERHWDRTPANGYASEREQLQRLA